MRFWSYSFASIVAGLLKGGELLLGQLGHLRILLLKPKEEIIGSVFHDRGARNKYVSGCQMLKAAINQNPNDRLLHQPFNLKIFVWQRTCAHEPFQDWLIIEIMKE